jgi:hypothetical protein
MAIALASYDSLIMMTGTKASRESVSDIERDDGPETGYALIR